MMSEVGEPVEEAVTAAEPMDHEAADDAEAGPAEAEDASSAPGGDEANTVSAEVDDAESGAEARPPSAGAASTDADGDDDTAEADDTAAGGDTGSDGEVTTERVIEAVLFASDAPLTPAKIVSIVGVGTARDVRKHIDALNRRYEKQSSSFRIQKLAGGYQMLTLPVYHTWVRRLKQTRQDTRLSQAALETLAVVAYKQPVVRADIEVVRGVAAGEMLNRLRELGLIKIVGRAEDVGRPMLYGTTRRFLELFGLSSLDDLPEVEELQAPE